MPRSRKKKAKSGSAAAPASVLPDELHVSESSSDEEEESSADVGSHTSGQQAQGGGNPDDTSSEEWPEGITRNTVGNVPMEWYEEHDHIGYDIDGQRIMKGKRRDQIEEFLAKQDDPDYWRTVYDTHNDRDVVLTDRQIEILRRVQKGQYADTQFDPYEISVAYDNDDWFHPLSNAPEPKRRFIPSKWEAKRVAYLVKAIRKGWIKLDKDASDEKPRTYDLWAEDGLDTAAARRARMHIAAPKTALPDHAMSYNPPDEYLLTAEEKQQWDEMDAEERPYSVLPTKHSSLRVVPSHQRALNDRFERCLDLYLCPRGRRRKMNVNPDKMLPKLPAPRDLRPFPSKLSVEYVGHMSRIRCIATDPSGEWLASGSDDGTVKLWEVDTGRCVRTWRMPKVEQAIPEQPEEGESESSDGNEDGNSSSSSSNDEEEEESIDEVDRTPIVYSLAWNPVMGMSLLAVGLRDTVIILSPGVASREQQESTDAVFRSERYAPGKRRPWWRLATPEEWRHGFRVSVSVVQQRGRMARIIGSVDDVSWHRAGDYLSTVSSGGGQSLVLVHRLSTASTQTPFKRAKGIVSRAVFHPTKPVFFVATQRMVRVYNLAKQRLVKKLNPGVKWISTMAVHPSGDHVLIGSYDKRVAWFDLDWSSQPYKTLRYHRMAVRKVCIHPTYPLFASCSDDATAHVFHGMVYSDLLQNPLLVPLKILRGHEVQDHLGVLDAAFHPKQPWLFTAGSDAVIKLYT